MFEKCPKCNKMTDQTILKTKRSKVVKVYCLECREILYPASKDLIKQMNRDIKLNHMLNY